MNVFLYIWIFVSLDNPKELAGQRFTSTIIRKQVGGLIKH